MSETVVTIHQPNYLPYLGYFDKMAHANIFVILDTVQFTKHIGLCHRNKIRTKDNPMWLTIPTPKISNELPINEVRVANNNWQKKHWKAIKLNYVKSKFWNKYSDFLERTYSHKYEKIIGVNIPLIMWLREQLDIKTKLIFASQLNIDKNLKATDLIINIVKELDGTAYISGKLGYVNYVEKHKFAENGLELFYQDYKYPIYEQHFSGFFPNLSAIDFLFNTGNEVEWISKESIKKG